MMVATGDLLIFGFLFLFISLFIPSLHYLRCVRIISKKALPDFEEFTPEITIFLPIKNESIVIKNKLNEIMNYDYPIEKIHLLLIDSNSTDDTVKIAQEFLNTKSNILSWEIKKIDLPGKSNAVNAALDIIKTDFFVMLDAEAITNGNSISCLISNFLDKEIGAVCGFLKPLENNPDSKYRTIFNIFRFGESLLKSTPIFEGSLCAFRMESIGKKRINPNINSDDTQLALIIKRNGFRAIMNDQVFFTEPPVFGKSRYERQLRRSQGLIRTLFENRDLIVKSDFKLIYLHTLFFHLFLPHIFIFSLLLIFLGTISYGNYEFYLLLFIVVILCYRVKLTRNFLYGIYILFNAQILTFMGKKLNVWETNQEIRRNVNRYR